MKLFFVRFCLFALVFSQGAVKASLVIEEKPLHAEVISSTFLGYQKYKGLSEVFFDGELKITLIGLHVDKNVCALNIYSKQDKKQLTKGSEFFDVKDIKSLSLSSDNVFNPVFKTIHSDKYTYSVRADPLFLSNKITCQVTVMRVAKSSVSAK
jgi:hypothetical protein